MKPPRMKPFTISLFVIISFLICIMFFQLYAMNDMKNAYVELNEESKKSQQIIADKNDEIVRLKLKILDEKSK